MYHGESGHSSYYGGRYHLEGLASKNPGNVLYCHNLEFHPDSTMSMRDFVMTNEANFDRPILRQSREGVAIANSMRDRDRGFPIIIMNSKKEFLHPGVIRTTFTPLATS